MKTNYFLVLLISLFVSANGSAQEKQKPAVRPAKIKTSKLNLKTLPKEVTYDGYIVYSARWKDKAGEHIFIASETGVKNGVDSSGAAVKNAYFTAQHYLINDSVTRTWTESDSVAGCQLNLQAGFVQSGFNVTDIDKDGVGEVWMMLKKACLSDVSPADLQLVIHEDFQRYSMIGTEKTRLSKTDVIGGEFDINNDFREGNELFLLKAKDVWFLYGKDI